MDIGEYSLLERIFLCDSTLEEKNPAPPRRIPCPQSASQPRASLIGLLDHEMYCGMSPMACAGKRSGKNIR